MEERVQNLSGTDISENPFSSLFSSHGEAENFKNSKSSTTLAEPGQSVIPTPAEGLETSLLIEKVLQVTLERTLPDDGFVFLEDLSCALGEGQNLDLEYLNQALFERLMLLEPDSKSAAPEMRILFYLYQSFYRLSKKTSCDRVKTISEALIDQCCMFLCHPDLFPSVHSSPAHLIDLLWTYRCESGHHEVLKRFLVTVAERIVARGKNGEDEVTLTNALSPAFEDLRQRVLSLTLINTELAVSVDILHFFTQSHLLSEAFLDFSTPGKESNGRAYQNGLLGAFLSVGCLPKTSTEPYLYFENPAQLTPQEHAITETNLWAPMSSLTSELQKIFHIILKQTPQARHRLLSWIGKCLRANNGRSKLWNSQIPGIADVNLASDGFMLNLESVLLLLCKPFVESLSPKILRIDATYCRVGIGADAGESIHLPGLSEETPLITAEEGSDVVVPSPQESYNFLTEVFFLTHYALRCGFKVVHEQLVKLSQELGRIQRLYEESRVQGGETSEVVQNIKNRMERGMTRFLSIKAAVLEPQALENMLAFHVATATWLTQIATNRDLSEIRDVTFPLSSDIPRLLFCVPEFIVENVTDCVIFMKQFSAKNLGLESSLDNLMTMILVFMGSTERMKNPHLRANLAEMLEALMPSQEQADTLFSTLHRDLLFKEHPLISNLVPTLLHVFVSIEMTGQSVAFEQKFQYRRPMYIVLDYLWTVEIHKNEMKEMSQSAEINIDSVTPPLFLKFINLLMNDAIFLLDEALSSMTQLREQQQERSTWSALPPQQRQQREANLHHMGLLARFYNVMGNETIRTLEWLTTEIQSIFCHPTIVDRMAAMLNYFLYHLVGPKKKNLKVNDLGEFEFKPQELVRDICKIYLHLGGETATTSRAFCSAVSRDGRSYSPELFVLAQGVLYKIAHSSLAVELEGVAGKVNELATEYEKDEIALADAPEEFLDPIMNTIMSDPVTLPSSGMVIDKATIARHLLSDQTDPFNRSMLTMEMVVPNEDLKTRIQSWIGEHKSKS